MSWAGVSFGEVLAPNRRPYTLGPTENADLVGMRLYGLGPFHREYKLASKIRKKSHFRIREGDVIYNKLFAWKGTFGTVPAELDGMLVSDKFPTYELDESLVHRPYLAWYFQCPRLWDEARRRSKGSAALSKLTLNPPKFLELPLPLPALGEQRRVAQLLDDLVSKMETARELSRTSSSQLAELPRSIVEKIIGSTGSRLGVLADVLVEKPRNGWSPKCDPRLTDGTAVLALGAVTGFRYQPGSHKITALPTDPEAHYWLRTGDLLITRSNTPELVGHCAIYSGNPSPCIYPDLMMRLRVDEQRVLPEFVHVWLQTGTVRRFVREKMTGTSPTMKKISQKIVEAFPFPVEVSLVEQERVISEYEGACALADRVEVEHASVQRELESAIPRLLDKAFAGEL